MDSQKKKQCHVCCKSFASNSSLQVHMRVHTKEKPYMCNLCGNCFTQKSSLSTHMILHSGKKEFGCTYCGKLFALKIYRTTHERACKAKPKTETFESNKVNECYDQNHYTITNLTYRNTESRDPYHIAPNIYDSNKYSAQSSESHKVHNAASVMFQSPSQNVPLSYVPVQINVMNRTIANQEVAKPNLPDIKEDPVNSNEQPTLLNLDDFAEKNKNRSEKPFQCKLCGQMYSQKSSFRTHLILHSGIKNFQCDWCYKKFALKLYKTSHEKSCRKKAISQVPFQCPVPQKSVLNKAIKRHSSIHIQRKPSEVTCPTGSIDQVLASSAIYIDEVEQLISS